MLGYVCKYAPVEIFESMGSKICRLDPTVTNFNQADTLMHANVCSFTKAVLEDVMTHDYEGVIFTTCCDSMRRLYEMCIRDSFKTGCHQRYPLHPDPADVYAVCHTFKHWNTTDPAFFPASV